MTKLSVSIEGRSFDVEFERWLTKERTVELIVNGERLQVMLPMPDLFTHEVEWFVVGQRPYEIVFDHDLRWLRAYGGLHHVSVRDSEASTFHPRNTDGRIKAPIPGLITRVLVQAGQVVEVGQTVVVLEAMKMENEIRASTAGVIARVLVMPGESVARGSLLAEIGGQR